MKRITLFVVCAVFVAGCSDSTPVVDKAGREQVRQQVQEYGERLLELKNQARTLESQMQFAQAAEVWQQVASQIRNDFGENSWQAINARVAHKLALKKQSLKNEHSNELVEMATLEKEIVAAHRAQNSQKSLQLSQRLLSIIEPLLGDVSMETARLKMQIGAIENQLNLDESAAKNLHAGIEIFRDKGIELHPELETALASLASIYTKREKFGPAVANQKSATQIAGMIWGTDSLQYATQANQLGVIFHRAGNHKVAKDVLNSAKKIREQKLGGRSFEYAQSCLNLGIVALAQHNLNQAEKELTTARQLFVSQKGVENEFSIRCGVQLATALMLQNRPDSAEKILKQVVEATEKSASSKELADYRYKLSIALARQGKYKEAEPMLLQVLSKQISAQGAASQQALSTMKALARLYEATHQKEKLNAVRSQLNQTSRVASGSDFQPQY